MGGARLEFELSRWRECARTPEVTAQYNRRPPVNPTGEPTESGFTLIELLVTVILLAILAVVVVPVYVGHRQNSERAVAQQQLAAAGRFAVTAETAGAVLSVETSGDSQSLVASGFGSLPLSENVEIVGVGGDPSETLCFSQEADGVVFRWDESSASVGEGADCGAVLESPSPGGGGGGGLVLTVGEYPGWRYLRVSGTTTAVAPGGLVYLWVHRPGAGTPTYVMWATVQGDTSFLFDHVNGGTVLDQPGTYTAIVTQTAVVGDVLATQTHVEP